VLTRLVYTARALPVGLVGAALALSVAPAVLTLARGGEELSAVVLAAIVIGAAALTWTSADAAGELLASTPASLLRRRAARLAVLTGATLLVWGVVLLAVVSRDPGATTPELDRLAELAAVGGLSVAAGAAADRRVLSVTSAAIVGPLCVLTISALEYRFPSLPALGTRGDTAAWGVIAAAGWLVALWESRDLYGFAVRRPAR
jgi:hypothetical protein